MKRILMLLLATNALAKVDLEIKLNPVNYAFSRTVQLKTVDNPSGIFFISNRNFLPSFGGSVVFNYALNSNTYLNLTTGLDYHREFSEINFDNLREKVQAFPPDKIKEQFATSYIFVPLLLGLKRDMAKVLGFQSFISSKVGILLGYNVNKIDEVDKVKLKNRLINYATLIELGIQNSNFQASLVVNAVFAGVNCENLKEDKESKKIEVLYRSSTIGLNIGYLIRDLF